MVIVAPAQEWDDCRSPKSPNIVGLRVLSLGPKAQYRFGPHNMITSPVTLDFCQIEKPMFASHIQRILHEMIIYWMLASSVGFEHLGIS